MLKIYENLSWHNGRLSDGFRWLKILSVLKTKRESRERPHADAGCGHWSFTPDRAAALMPSMLPRLKSSEPINSRNPDVWWWKISLFDSQSMWILRHFSDFLGEFYPKKMILKDDLSILHFYIYYILYIYYYMNIDWNVSSLTWMYPHWLCSRGKIPLVMATDFCCSTSPPNSWTSSIPGSHPLVPEWRSFSGTRRATLDEAWQ